MFWKFITKNRFFDHVNLTRKIESILTTILKKKNIKEECTRPFKFYFKGKFLTAANIVKLMCSFTQPRKKENLIHEDSILVTKFDLMIFWKMNLKSNY